MSDLGKRGFRFYFSAYFSVMKHILFVLLIFLFTNSTSVKAQEVLRVVALGDSLTAGYGLPQGEDFTSKLEMALQQRGLNVKIENAGITGDTTAGGLRRLPGVIAGEPKPRLVIVALGAGEAARAKEHDGFPAIARLDRRQRRAQWKAQKHDRRQRSTEAHNKAGEFR